MQSTSISFRRGGRVKHGVFAHILEEDSTSPKEPSLDSCPDV